MTAIPPDPTDDHPRNAGSVQGARKIRERFLQPLITATGLASHVARSAPIGGAPEEPPPH
jgi:hypothetical protein